MHYNFDASDDAEYELQEIADNLVADLEMTDVMLIQQEVRTYSSEVPSE